MKHNFNINVPWFIVTGIKWPNWTILCRPHVSMHSSLSMKQFSVSKQPKSHCPILEFSFYANNIKLSFSSSVFQNLFTDMLAWHLFIVQNLLCDLPPSSLPKPLAGYATSSCVFVTGYFNSKQTARLCQMDWHVMFRMPGLLWPDMLLTHCSLAMPYGDTDLHQHWMM